MRAASHSISGSALAGDEFAAPAPTSRERDYALDWVKGALVLLMVLYHWLNYFIGLDWPGYPYLRFLTPSFLFITGYIVGRVYLVKYAGTPWQLAQRSWQRGLKLLALFCVLNLADTAVALRSVDPADLARAWPIARIETVLLEGAGGAAFSILVPIAYFLMAVPLVWWLVRVAGIPLWTLAALALAAAVVGSLTPLANAQFEFLSIGLAGAALGAARRFDLAGLASHMALLLIAYGAHLAAIAAWNAPFAMQVVTTYLNVTLLYACASRLMPDISSTRAIAELGAYSLFAYIVQIVVLQVLKRSVDSAGGLTPILAALVALAATWSSVRLMATLRRLSPTVDRSYRMLFA